MRRKDREVTDIEKLLEIVEECEVVRLGFSDEEGPYIVPLNYGYEYKEGKLSLYIHGAQEGRKAAPLRSGQKIAIEMDTDHAPMEMVEGKVYSYAYKCIIGTGTPVELLTSEDKRHGLNVLMKHVFKKEIALPEPMLKAVAVFRIDVDKFTGKMHSKD